MKRKVIIAVLCSVLLFLILGKEGYDDTIGKLNTGVLATGLFVMFWIYAFQLVKFNKSKEKINEIFSKYIMYFFIVNFGILILKGLHLFQIFKFDYTEIIEEVICLIISGVVLVKEKIAEEKEKKKKEIEKQKKSEEDKNQLFDSRKPQSDALIKLLEDDRDNSMILINGEWGIGKTFFVEKTLEMPEISENIENIFIDVMLFNSRKSLKDELFGEIELILEDNGIATKSIREINNYMDSIIESDNKLINLALKFLKSKTFQKGKDGVEESIKKLTDKKIVVVIDNLERVLKKEDVIEIMGFLHEIQSIENISFIVCADKEKLKEMIEDDNYVEKFFLQEIELREIDVEEIIEGIGIEINYKDIIIKVVNEIFEDLEKREWNYSNLKKENDKSKNKEEYIKNINEEYIKSGKTIARIKKKIGNSRVILKITECVKQYNQTHKNIYLKEISEKRYLEILIRISIFKVILENKYIEILEEKEKKFKEVLIERKDINKKILEKSIDVIKEPIIISTIIKYNNIMEEKAYFRILESVFEEDKIINTIEQLDINKIKKEEYFDIFEKLSKYYKYFDIYDKTIKIYSKLRENIFELNKEEYINILCLYEIAELEKRYNAGKKIEKSIYERYTEFKIEYDIKIYYNFQRVYLECFEIFYMDKDFLQQKNKIAALKDIGGTDFIKSVSNMFKRSKEIEERIKKYSEEIDNCKKINELNEIEKIFIEEIENSKVEGKEELKINISNFFYIFKKLMTVKEKERIVKELSLDFKGKNYFEQRDLLNSIRESNNFKEYDDLKKEIINILPDVKVEFYNILNIVKERATKTENQ